MAAFETVLIVSSVLNLVSPLAALYLIACYQPLCDWTQDRKNVHRILFCMVATSQPFALAGGLYCFIALFVKPVELIGILVAGTIFCTTLLPLSFTTTLVFSCHVYIERRAIWGLFGGHVSRSGDIEASSDSGSRALLQRDNRRSPIELRTLETARSEDAEHASNEGHSESSSGRQTVTPINVHWQPTSQEDVYTSRILQEPAHGDIGVSSRPYNATVEDGSGSDSDSDSDVSNEPSLYPDDAVVQNAVGPAFAEFPATSTVPHPDPQSNAEYPMEPSAPLAGQPDLSNAPTMFYQVPLRQYKTPEPDFNSNVEYQERLSTSPTIQTDPRNAPIMSHRALPRRIMVPEPDFNSNVEYEEKLATPRPIQPGPPNAPIVTNRALPQRSVVPEPDFDSNVEYEVELAPPQGVQAGPSKAPRISHRSLPTQSMAPKPDPDPEPGYPSRLPTPPTVHPGSPAVKAEQNSAEDVVARPSNDRPHYQQLFQSLMTPPADILADEAPSWLSRKSSVVDHRSPEPQLLERRTIYRRGDTFIGTW